MGSTPPLTNRSPSARPRPSFVRQSERNQFSTQSRSSPTHETHRREVSFHQREAIRRRHRYCLHPNWSSTRRLIHETNRGPSLQFSSWSHRYGLLCRHLNPWYFFFFFLLSILFFLIARFEGECWCLTVDSHLTPSTRHTQTYTDLCFSLYLFFSVTSSLRLSLSLSLLLMVSKRRCNLNSS